MAFLNHLFSTPGAEVEAVRDNSDVPISPSLALSVSHLIAYWVQVQPLGQLLGRAIDGGTVLNPDLRHQLRGPCYHDAAAVRSLLAQLSAEWHRVTSAEPIPPDDWYRVEIEKVLRVFTHAADRGEYVVSALEPNNGLFVRRDNKRE